MGIPNLWKVRIQPVVFPWAYAILGADACIMERIPSPIRAH